MILIHRLTSLFVTPQLYVPARFVTRMDVMVMLLFAFSGTSKQIRNVRSFVPEQGVNNNGGGGENRVQRARNGIVTDWKNEW